MRTISLLFLTCLLGTFLKADTNSFLIAVNRSGIGAILREENGSPTVQTVFPKSPASLAGLKEGDKIIQVNDTKTDGLTLIQVVNLIRGPQGTEIKLTVRRLSEASEIIFTVTREPILFPKLNSAATEAPPASSSPASTP